MSVACRLGGAAPSFYADESHHVAWIITPFLAWICDRLDADSPDHSKPGSRGGFAVVCVLVLRDVIHFTDFPKRFQAAQQSHGPLQPCPHWREIDGFVEALLRSRRRRFTVFRRRENLSLENFHHGDQEGELDLEVVFARLVSFSPARFRVVVLLGALQ